MISKIEEGIKNPKKAAAFLKYRLLKPFGGWNYIPFIVLSRSRTGSNLLISFLDSHPNIYARDEVFGWLHGKTPRQALEEFYCRQPPYIKAAGCKIFYYHPQDEDSGEIWKRLMDMRKLRVIHLKRDNILRTLLSRKIAGRQDTWKDTQSESNLTKKKWVFFTFNELKQGFEQTRHWEIEYQNLFSSHPMINISYEDLIRNPENEFKRITDFLFVSAWIPQTSLKKQNPEPASRLIVNYEELKNAFAGTKWERFFEDSQ